MKKNKSRRSLPEGHVNLNYNIINSINKPIFTFLYIISIVISSFHILNAQNWTTSGAKWTYSFNSLFSFGYVKIEHVGDTLINNKICDILKKTKYGNTWPGNYDTLDLGNEYTYLDSGRIWVYRANQFWILYDFNFTVGNTWTCMGNNIPCPQVGEFLVDSISFMVVNNDTLKIIYTSPSSGSEWSFVGPIVEKIGCLGYMFPEPACVFDAEEGGPFRCYSDSSGWTFISGITPTCDFINVINSPKDLYGYKLFPNPASTSFNICLNDFNRNELKIIYIFNYQGQLLNTFEITENNFFYSTNFLNNGIYIVRVRDSKKTFSILLVINKNMQ